MTIFFDKSCSLCRRTVNFIAKHNRKKNLQYAALHSKTGKKLLPVSLRNLDTVVFVEQEKVWIRSQAVFRILWYMGGAWKLVGWLYVMPFLDSAYRLIARHRKRGGKMPPLKVELLP